MGVMRSFRVARESTEGQEKRNRFTLQTGPSEDGNTPSRQALASGVGMNGITRIGNTRF
jgi:hypothetical protein